ncbi:Cupredoxin [Choiromyces venosus 120613-1]|uniref:Cupredoxin n=1 Tax=Choiromyces venosus 120613-1 TaxID=1336337 RepID=A0A3N4J131_9PEZI|nr:Cupredoxin [Choiromyces venosus 120613-1]
MFNFLSFSTAAPAYNFEFQFPLPMMPVKTPIATYTNATTRVAIDFYQVTMQAFTKKLFPNLGDANLIGYNSVAPGPTFRIQKGRETDVRFVNEWAEDTIQPGEYKDYYYPNNQAARTLWYHDHAVGITSLNTYAGLAGMYILEDAAQDETLDLPRGNHDIPLILQSRRYTANSNITDESGELTSVYRDTFSVNGQILPYLDVEPRKYRFRVLNAATSRTFNITLQAGNSQTNKKFHVTGSDGGLMSNPVETESLVSANVTMNHANCFVDTAYAGSAEIMQCRVGATVSLQVGNNPLPATLVNLDLPTDHTTIDQTFAFGRAGGQWTVNGQAFSNAANRILRNVPCGTTEKWRLTGGNGWSHPIISREKTNANLTTSRSRFTPYEAAALKDVAALGNNEAVTPWGGVYMLHCHNTIHEDHDMMAAFNVTALSNFGYPETTMFEDPMEARFRATAYSGSEVGDIQAKLEFFSSLGAYYDVAGIQAALDDYRNN